MKNGSHRQHVAKVRRTARESWNRLRTIAASRPSPLAGLSEHEAIERLRAAREELWHQKLAIRP
jgi:hypothetical protein